jgi:hypothetical protein
MDSFLVVNPIGHDLNLIDEFKNIVNVFQSRDIRLLFLSLDVVDVSNNYLRSCDWISFHPNGIVSVYPMSDIVRQKERCDLVFDLLESHNFIVNSVVDFTEAETEGFFLEGLGAVVLDRKCLVAYASLSTKCDEELFIEFCEELEFTPIIFRASFSDGSPVLLTSSMLKISNDFVFLASSLIADKKDRKLVLSQLRKTGREVFLISEEQVSAYVAEITQITNKKGQKFVVMSETSFVALSDIEIRRLKLYGEVLVFDCKNIENFGNHSLGAMLNQII